MVANFLIRFVGPALVFLSPLLVSVDWVENVLPFNAHLDGAFGWYQLVLLMFLGGWGNAFGDMLDDDDLLKRHLSPRLLQLMRFACHSHTICVGLVILCQSNPLPGAVLSSMYAHAWVVRGKAGIKSKPAETLVVLLALVPLWSLIGGRFFGMMGHHRLDQDGGFALPWLACLGSSNIWLPLSRAYGGDALPVRAIKQTGIFRVVPAAIAAHMTSLPVAAIISGVIILLADVAGYDLCKALALAARPKPVTDHLYKWGMVYCGFCWSIVYLSIAWGCGQSQNLDSLSQEDSDAVRDCVPLPAVCCGYNLFWAVLYSAKNSKGIWVTRNQKDTWVDTAPERQPTYPFSRALFGDFDRRKAHRTFLPLLACLSANIVMVGAGGFQFATQVSWAAFGWGSFVGVVMLLSPREAVIRNFKYSWYLDALVMTHSLWLKWGSEFVTPLMLSSVGVGNMCLAVRSLFQAPSYQPLIVGFVIYHVVLVFWFGWTHTALKELQSSSLPLIG
jgi:hypothetical protein